MSEIFRSLSHRPLLAAILVLFNLVLFLQVGGFYFVDFDDHLYITQNRHIQELNWESVIWAFKAGYAANWHPLTWLSHMFDYHVFGALPGGHHLVNLILHTLNTVLLALLLLKLTGKLWCSFIVALLFAVHPLHVESIAWVSERKDLLCTLFGLLSMYSYSLYAERKKRGFYSTSLLLFACSLMSKPMLVTLPFLLLLLDFWPLERVGFTVGGGLKRLAGAGGLFFEKLPFFALSLISSVITFTVQREGGAVSPLELVPLESRWINAVESYGGYIYKSLFPLKLSIFYPYEEYRGYWQPSFAAALLLLVGITLLVIKLRKSRPYLPVGWFWFLGTLVPVIGVVQVGGQSMADRYMYVPLVGLLILAVFGASEALSGLTRRVEAVFFTLSLITLIFALLSHRQAGYWKDSISLFERAIRVNPGNYMAHTRLGVALSSGGSIARALEHYREAVRIKPEYVTAHYDMAVDLNEMGRVEEAIIEFKRVIEISPVDFSAHMSLGDIYRKRGRVSDAIGQYLRAKKLRPESLDLYNALGILYAEGGKMEKAEETLSEGASLFPDNAEIHSNLGLVYYYMGNSRLAIGELRAAIEFKEGYADAHNNLGLALIQAGKPQTAIKHFREALRLKPGFPAALGNLRNLRASGP